jgi:uncharacterized protein (DUF58 family)
VLTRDGRILLVVAVVAGGTGRLLGVPELLAVALGLAVLLVVVTVLVRSRRLHLEVARTLQPRRVPLGADASIELRATNRARRGTPVLRLHDRVRGTRGATLLLAPLASGRTSRAVYRLPTTRRGRLRVGPLDVVAADPFGLVEVRTHAAAVDELIVLPTVEAVLPPPPAPGDEDDRSFLASRSVASGSGDLHSLRPYVVGDDLRRVHWRSSARHGDLLVRVDEEPWHGRTTVLLDVRRSTSTLASVEQVVSAAASILTAAHGRGDAVRVAVAGSRAVPEHAGGPHALERLCDELAVLQQAPDDPIEPTVRALVGTGDGGTLVVVASAPATSSDRRALEPLRARFGTVVVVDVATDDEDGHAGRTAWPVADVVVAVGVGQALRAPWDLAVSPTRRP